LSVELLWLTRPADSGCVLVDGHRVPNIEVWRHKGGSTDGQLSVSLFRHGAVFFTIDVTDEAEVQRWLPLLANAMACAAGFTSFGANSLPMNPYGCKARFLGNVDDVAVPDTKD
jgi:hypothetical protein